MGPSRLGVQGIFQHILDLCFADAGATVEVRARPLHESIRRRNKRTLVTHTVALPMVPLVSY
jgi:hypothetical protein